MEDMVAAGMTPAQVLVAATGAAAEFLRMPDVGTVAAGKSADFVVLDANPLDNITNTRRIAAVVVRGRRFQRDDLEGLLAAVAAMPDQRVNDWRR
jgi:imidazolonepropionase-like amidohydrolase